jgi:hypothetical protein
MRELQRERRNATGTFEQHRAARRKRNLVRWKQRVPRCDSGYGDRRTFEVSEMVFR